VELRLVSKTEKELFQSLVNEARAQGVDLLEDFDRPLEFYRTLSPESRSCLDELCELGCDTVPICFFAFVTRFGIRVDRVMEVAFGPSEERASMARKLDQIAQALDRGNLNISEQSLTASRLLHPQELVLQLRKWSNLLAFPLMLGKCLGARSAGEFFRYAFTKYVKSATGRPNDRLVSGVLTGLFDDSSGLYCVENQRMWRTRHAARADLDSNASVLVNVIISFSRLELDAELST